MMRDPLTASARSRLMARVRQKHTAPEIATRRLIHALGLRFTVNGPRNRTLPGSPDIVLPMHRIAIFVHGCFWHRHRGCSKATTPTARRTFWLEKFTANVARDRRVVRKLRAAGWRVLVIWECEVRDVELVIARLQRTLDRRLPAQRTARNRRRSS